MKATNKWTIAAVSALVLMLGASSLAAIITPVSYDFGTDAGKQTYTAAGFSFANETNAVAGPSVLDVADGVQINSTDSRLRSGIQRTFTGLGVNEVNDFTISTTMTIDSWNAAQNNDRVWGIHLFGLETDLQSGLTARIEGNSSSPDRIEWNLGVDAGTGGYLSTGTLTLNDGLVQAGETYTFTVDGVFDTVGGNLNLGWTISDGVGSQTLNTSIALTELSGATFGNYFGIAGDNGNSAQVTIDTFSVVPEPATLGLVAVVGGTFVFIRRRFMI